jgi:agmatine/peptidylarginine deiminase
MGMMAGVATLNRSEWKNALDQLTADYDGQQVTIELLDPLVGHQHEAERLPFSYINFDVKDDVIIVAVGGNRAGTRSCSGTWCGIPRRWMLPSKVYRNRR